VTRAASGRGGRGLSLILGGCPELEVELSVSEDPCRTILSTRIASPCEEGGV
jgi:hypothetical protein